MDGFLQLGMYSYLVRMIVEGILNVWRPHEKVIKLMVFLVSAAFVYWGRVDPAALMGMKVAPEMIGPVGTALLAGAAMGTNDLLNVIRTWGSVTRR
jgi:hypothetical protein